MTATDRLADECHGYDLDGYPVVRVSRKAWWAVDAAIRGAWWSAKTDVERECWRSLQDAWADCYSYRDDPSIGGRLKLDPAA